MHRDESLRELLAEVETVAPIPAEHARSSESLGRLDDTSIEAVHKTRLLRMSVPRDLGGQFKLGQPDANPML